MTCNWCHKTNIDDWDMHNDTMCDDCFDKMMDEEEKDFQIFHNQNGKCAICNNEMGMWQIRNGLAICSKHTFKEDPDYFPQL